jgi:KUP system potassium uptake protein
MGHFGRPPITRAWLILVFPACILSYLGQGALILDNPEASSAPFFRLMPHGGLVPLVLLATAATVIASQAVISGAFSIARQASQLGYLPRLRVIHTSEREIGQVYVPIINWLLLAGVLVLVLAFESSAKLAFAYGTAVTGTIITTTVLFFVIARHRWSLPVWLVAIGAIFFLVMELTFFAANLTKIGHGAWLPIIIGIVLFTVMATWYRGRALVTAERKRVEGPLQHFVDQLRSGDRRVTRVPGTAVFLNRGKETAPLSMRECVEHLHSLNEHVIILSLDTISVPRVRDADRLEIDDLGYKDDGITFVRAKHGYVEDHNVPRVVRLIAKAGVESPLEVNEASYYLSKVELKPSGKPGMSRWRKHLFLATAVLTAEPADYFGLPREQTVILGSQIEF